jgi:hypothetical protein
MGAVSAMGSLQDRAVVKAFYWECWRVFVLLMSL